MPEPILFISHKHTDNKIAQVLAEFCEDKSNGRIKVHLSSSPDFEGPRIGKGVNAQLRKALWDTDVLILIYTSPEQDWSYCMWECGVANDSQSPETSIIVFQCGSDFPALFNDVLRVNVRNFDDIKKFMQEFLRSPDFFPRLNGAVAPNLKDKFVEEAAKTLHTKMSAVLPRIDEGLSEEWPTWPYLKIELPQEKVDSMEQINEVDRYNLIKDFGTIVESDSRAPQIFGLADFPNKMKISALLKKWKSNNANAEEAWFESCCNQIMMGVSRGFPIIQLTSIKAKNDNSDYTPILSRIKALPYSGTVQFDFYFYNLSDPRAVSIKSKMIPISDFFHKKLGQIDLQTFKLTDLIKELNSRQLNRLPILSDEGYPMYIIHRSMVEQFIVKHVLAGGAATVADLTLANLLDDSEMKNIFQNTFAIVKEEAALSDAINAMRAKPGSNDVFVTAKGNLNEPVKGWLTNVDITRNS